MFGLFGLARTGSIIIAATVLLRNCRVDSVMSQMTPFVTCPSQVAKRVFACKYASQLMRRYLRMKNNQRRKLRISRLDDVVKAKVDAKLLARGELSGWLGAWLILLSIAACIACLVIGFDGLLPSLKDDRSVPSPVTEPIKRY